MIGVVIVTHCRLAQELVDTAKMIVGDLPQVEAVCLDPGAGPEEARRDIEKAIAKVDDGDGVLILTDMFGGTPSNLSLSFLADDKREVLTGVNLPMLLKLGVGREGKSLREVARFIKEYGQKNISLATEVLAKRVERKEDAGNPGPGR